THIFIKVLKIIGWIFLALIILVVVILLFIRSPWGQGIIVDKAVAYVTDKTQTEIHVDRLFITFSGNIFVEGLYMEDQQSDTLLYSHSLETGVAFLPLINSGAIHLSKLEWDGLKARVSRSEETKKFNFDFITEAFMSDTDTLAAEPAVTDSAASSFPDIDLGPIDLTNFDLSYADEVMGIEGNFKMETLSLDMERMDLNKMDFYIKDFLFSNSVVFYKQTKPFEEGVEDTTSSAMPVVIIDHLAINNVEAYYESVPDGMVADLSLGEFLVVLPEANLEKNEVILKNLKLHDSQIIYKSAAQEPQEEASKAMAEASPSPDAFEWPDWTVDVDNIS